MSKKPLWWGAEVGFNITLQVILILTLSEFISSNMSENEGVTVWENLKSMN